MDSLLGFAVPPPSLDADNDVVGDKPQQNFKLVPWISWDEWAFVNDSLFSSSPPSVASALRRVAAWRSRGCLPVEVEVTASIIEIQQKDPFFRNDFALVVEQSEEMLAMLYCMAIMRLVNSVVEKTRKKNEISIAEAADAIGLPRMLIDIRHEGSHRDLPSLQLVRIASTKALDWLKSYYWEPQKSAIPIQGDVIANLRKEIKQKLLELAFCLNVKPSTRSSSSLIKGKRSKKHIMRSVKNVLRLYSSYSSEVADVIIEILLKALESSDVMELLDNSESKVDYVQACHDWKSVISKLSRKEPELLLTLLRAALDMYETKKRVILEKGEHLSLQNAAESRQIVQLARLFEWLLNSLKHVQRKKSDSETDSSSLFMPKATLLEFLRKCVLISCNGDNQLTSSTQVLAHIIGDSTLIKKLNKLSLLSVEYLEDIKVLSPNTDSENFFSWQEDSIHQAVEKLDLIKLRQTRNKVKPSLDHVELKSRWMLVKSFNQCPIGMLPNTHGSSGSLPILDLYDDHEELPTSAGKDKCERDPGKRQAEQAVESLDDSSVKKIRDTTWSWESDNEDNSTVEGVKGHLMIDGFWKEVREEDILAISSAVRILL